MPVLPTGFTRARLDIEGGSALACWFNPTQYAVSKTNTWTTKAVVGASLPTAQFSGGQPRGLTLDLLFHDDPDGDITVATDALFAMMEVDPKLALGKANRGRPPQVKFSWGTYQGFWAVCSSLSVQFTLFRPDGTPTRATAQVSLVQVEKDPRAPRSSHPKGTNPTTRTTDQLAAHTVRDGDSLASIAWQHYADPTLWRIIAEANEIDDPLRLQRGATLSVPPART